MENKDFNKLPADEQIKEIIESGLSAEQIKEKLEDYHEGDIADAIQELTPDARLRLYKILGVERVSEIFSYIDDVSDYLKELSMQQAAKVLEHMDSDDAVDALEDIESEEIKNNLLSLMDSSSFEDIRLISSYDDDQIGSMMTTNFVTIPNTSTIKQAMKSLISQAHENDNINTIYAVDAKEQYYGAIELRDLIVARENTDLGSIISRNYPYVLATQTISETIEDLKNYAEDSIPVLDNEHRIIGVVTSQDIVEAVDDELGEDYAKLAGLTAEEDLHERVFESMKKRIPWLILLLFLGMGVSSVIGAFEMIVSKIAIIMCFQSLILDMAGNVGTQSLAVTIRVLMDENVSGREKAKFVLKEMEIGGANGLFLGTLSFTFVGMYLHFFKNYGWMAGFRISFCVGFALFLAMMISSLVGTLIPMFFHKIKIDPAVASGPLITTVNDLVSVIAYYGLATLMLAEHVI